jgi:hypothetical protein
MRQRPVTVVDCLWQARLQRRGKPLKDYIEHRQLCLLEPTAPAVAIAVNQYGRWVRMEQQLRRLDVMQRGSRIGLALTFFYGPDPNWRPFLRVVTTGARLVEKMPLYTEEFWRPAAEEERPAATTVFLEPGQEISTGRIVQVASTGAYPAIGLVTLGMLLVDVDDVKGLRCASWRLRKALLTDDPTWLILTTGKTRVDRVVPQDWEGWEG